MTHYFVKDAAKLSRDGLQIARQSAAFEEVQRVLSAYLYTHHRLSVLQDEDDQTWGVYRHNTGEGMTKLYGSASYAACVEFAFGLTRDDRREVIAE